MSFTAPNGEIFNSKKDYIKFIGNNARQKGLIVDNVYQDRVGSHTGRNRRKSKCPKCSKVDNLTRDWYGNLVCPDCFRRSL